MLDQIDKIPCFQQDHKNNEFKCTGDNELASLCSHIHRIYNYPSRNEQNDYLSMSPKGQAIYIQQIFDEPVGSRPADIIKIFRFKSDGDEFDISLFREFCSDLFFDGKAACVMDKTKAALNTWVMFTDILKDDPRLTKINHVIRIGESANNKVAPECEDLTPESFSHMISIFRKMPYSTENIRTAIKKAIIECGSHEKNTESAGSTISTHDAAPTCKYDRSKFNEFLKDKNTNGVLCSLPDAKKTNEKKTISHISAHGNQCAEHNTNSLSLVKKKGEGSLEYKAARDNVMFMIDNQQYLSLEEKCDLLYKCSIINDPECKEYISRFLNRICSDQDFRLRIAEKIWKSSSGSDIKNNCQKINFHGYNQEAALLTGDFEHCGNYVHDLFYLGIIDIRKYFSCISNGHLKCLFDLVAGDFAGCEANNAYNLRLERFLNNLTSRYGRKLSEVFVIIDEAHMLSHAKESAMYYMYNMGAGNGLHLITSYQTFSELKTKETDIIQGDIVICFKAVSVEEGKKTAERYGQKPYTAFGRGLASLKKQQCYLIGELENSDGEIDNPPAVMVTIPDVNL